MKARIAEKLAEIRERHQPSPAAPRGIERHYTPEQVAELWGVHPETVRREFAGRPGVLKIGNGGQRRRYVKLRIPESVLNAVHAEMSR